MSHEKQNVCDEGRFKTLFRELSKDLHDFLYYKYGAGNHPADIVQEAFVKLWNNCKNVPPEKARAFLFTVANNQMLNELAKRKTALRYQETAEAKRYTLESPEFAMEEEQYRQRLHAALESLTEDQRVTFMLNRVEGKKHQEIADMLGIGRKAVEKRIYKAYKIIREQLGDF